MDNFDLDKESLWPYVQAMLDEGWQVTIEPSAWMEENRCPECFQEWQIDGAKICLCDDDLAVPPLAD
jgi:hypothetical protein